MGKVIGIDLGTTNSCVALMDGFTNLDLASPPVRPPPSSTKSGWSLVKFGYEVSGYGRSHIKIIKNSIIDVVLS